MFIKVKTVMCFKFIIHIQAIVKSETKKRRNEINVVLLGSDILFPRRVKFLGISDDSSTNWKLTS